MLEYDPSDVTGGSRSIGASIVQRLAANRAGCAITHATHLFKD
jgi:NAD(P)-dependent dehydrogenase (short-subunit alcohol dehydrogenase family)